ncbi:MAG: Omega-amino acid--pyruvate aminotransferase, partial [uncultured Thermomicrobiales bacterium]
PPEPLPFRLRRRGRAGRHHGRPLRRAGDREPGAGDRRLRDRRAGLLRRRGPRPVSDLLADAAPDLRQARRPPDRRRGDQRLRAHRQDVRDRALWGRTGHHDDRQGAHVRLRADGGRRRPARHLRDVSAAKRGFHGPPADFRWAPGRRRRRPRQPQDLARRKPGPAKRRQGRLPQGPARRAARSPDRRRRPRRRPPLRDRAGQGQGDQGEVRQGFRLHRPRHRPDDGARLHHPDLGGDAFRPAAGRHPARDRPHDRDRRRGAHHRRRRIRGGDRGV